MDESVSGERWLPVPGYIGTYEVSDLGRVRSVDRVVVCRDGAEVRHRGQMLKGTVGNHGYRTVTLRYEQRLTQQVVLEAFVGARPESMEIRHLNGDKLDDRLSNLSYGTSAENSADTLAHGNHELVNREECPRGHRLAEPNLVVDRQDPGHRECLACARARGVVEQARRSGRELAVSFAQIADDRYGRLMALAHLPAADAKRLSRLKPGRRSQRAA